jgi:hypothetical protein
VTAGIALRHMVARPRALAAAPVTALAWLLTRVPMYLIDVGDVRDRWRWMNISDVRLYMRWLPFFLHGNFPVGDHRWQYPPGAAAVLSLPHLLPGSYIGSFLRVELLCDLIITVLLVHMAIRRGSWLGCWCWLVGVPLLGPIALGRFDIFAALFAVAALYFADSAWGLGAFAGLGAVVKVWPLLALFGVRRGQGRQAVIAAVAAGCAMIGGFLAFTHGSLSFLANQGSRGMEIESMAAQPFLVAKRLGLWHGSIVLDYGSFQVVGPGVDAAAGLMVGASVLALVALAVWRWRMSWRPEVAGDAALVAVLLMVTTSRVISVQYMLWLIAMAACALAFPRTSQRPVALLLMIAVALTQVEYPFLFYSNFRFFGIVGIVVTALRDAVLLAATLLGFVRLWRSTRGPRSAGGTAEALPRVQGFARQV